MRLRTLCLLLPLSLLLLHEGAHAQQEPSVLVVTAHPDDESTFAATIYKLTHDLGADVDLALITNGEGGYKYSTLGNAYYGLELTDEEVGREHLPTIRKKELMAGGDIIGIRNYYFFDEVDHRYTLNADSTLGYVWDTAGIATRLTELMSRGYDYVLTLLPTEETHGHHKAATILTLASAARIPVRIRPVVLAGSVASITDTLRPFEQLAGFPITRVTPARPLFLFDRNTSFGYRDRLNYKIIVNWLIAEHKSQGTMQLGMNRGDHELFWWFAINDPQKMGMTRALFERLQVNDYPELTY